MTTLSADPSLDEVLHKANFAEAFRAAIHRRNLTLDRIKTRLACRGITISLATLSYWQQGRSRPEREKSLEALRELEAILELPAGALFDFLEAPKPRGKGESKLPYPYLYGKNSTMGTVLGDLFVPFDQDIVTLSASEVVRIDASRSLRQISETRVGRAAKDGVDRFVCVFTFDEGEGMPSGIDVRGGALGEVRADDRTGHLVMEILIGRELAKNDTAIVEFDLTLDPSDTPARVRERRTSTPLYGFTERIFFDPAALPSSCHRYYRRTVSAPTEYRHRLLIDEASHMAHTFAPRCAPGVYGITWDWDS